jgi:hypothetical protein
MNSTGKSSAPSYAYAAAGNIPVAVCDLRCRRIVLGGFR